MDELSASDVQCLDDSFEENRLVDTYDLSKKSHVYMTGNIMAEMDFHFRKWFTLAIGVATNGIWMDKHDAMTDELKGRESGFTLTVLPQARFTWMNKDFIRLYSSVGAGITGGSFDGRSEAVIAAQAVPIGISIGGKLFGFAEVGIGTVYIGGMFGIGYRF